jgi:sec-independent protein translocase protein TatA
LSAFLTNFRPIRISTTGALTLFSDSSLEDPKMIFAKPWLDALIVLLVVLLFFGPKRLPALGKSLGEGMREFKDSITGNSGSDEEGERTELNEATSATPASTAPAPAPAQAASQPTAQPAAPPAPAEPAASVSPEPESAPVASSEQRA